MQLDPRPSPLLLGYLVAGAHREATEPGVPGIRVTECAQIPPGEEERILEGILGAMRVAEDEVGDALEPRRGCLHQLCEGIEIAGLGPFDEMSLHGRHRSGAKDFPALSQTKVRRKRYPFPDLSQTRRRGRTHAGVAPYECDPGLGCGDHVNGALPSNV